jgi:hypothetical protein
MNTRRTARDLDPLLARVPADVPPPPRLVLPAQMPPPAPRTPLWVAAVCVGGGAAMAWQHPVAIDAGVRAVLTWMASERSWTTALTAAACAGLGLAAARVGTVLAAVGVGSDRPVPR